MSVAIPCRPDLTHYSLQVVLSGATHTLEFHWNTREGAWYMDVRNEDESVSYCEGAKVVIGWFLGRRSTEFRKSGLGLFMALDTSGQDKDPEIADLGDRVMLAYYTQEEATDIIAGDGP